jgi:transcriptional regulator of arginine metabolism
MSVRRRRERILALVATGELSTQEEVADALRREGIDASQASVSRDIAALGLVKAGGRYAVRPAARQSRNPLEERVREFLITIAPAGDHLLVLKTPPGEASALGYAIDGLDLQGVVGSVAGDDTLFVALDGRAASTAVQRRLRAIQAGAPAGGR